VNGASEGLLQRPPRDGFLLSVHLRWILTVTAVVVLSAGVVSWALEKPAYQTEVKVLVGPRVVAGGAPLLPDMETEAQVATSGVVRADAARTAGVSPAYLQKRLSVTVPADSTVLQIRYSDATPATARSRATAVTDAYVTYRAGQASVLSPASTPRDATRPKYLLNLLAALVVGLALGTASALLRDRLDDRLRGPADLKRLVDLPVLATVPAPAAATEPHDGVAGPPLVSLPAPDSAAAEQYQFVRVKLESAAAQLAVHDARSAVLVLVTSAAADDGATTVAASTAVALARAGRRVLLVQDDPHARTSLELSGVDGLRVTSFPRVEGAVGRMDDRAAHELIDRARADGDFVVLRARPVLAVPEALVLADRVDLVLLVALAGSTTRRELHAAVAELQEARARLAGAVVLQRVGQQPEPVPPRAAPAKAPGPGLDRPTAPRSSADQYQRDAEDRQDAQDQQDASGARVDAYPPLPEARRG
jgi:succinoglycan biosynthesis transport protein ExoP